MSETPFNDMNGEPVTVGDKIIIVSNYNYQHLDGQHAVVIWDEKRGCYKYKYTEVRRKKEFTTEDDFNAIHEFKKVK
jgi:hypothetical protein